MRGFLKFFRKAIIIYLSDDKVNKNLDRQKKWDDDYEEYAAWVSRRKKQ